VSNLHWDSETRVLLYGAAHVGTQIYKRLSGQINIIAFLDKRADEIAEYMGLPVYAPSSDIVGADIKTSSVVVVCVKNIFEHEMIAQNLTDNGYKYIVFCPVNGSNATYRSGEDRDALTALYHALTEGGFTPPYAVPGAQGLFARSFRDSAVINRADGVVTAYIPSVFCYNRSDKGGIIRDVPMLSLFPYFELFQYFDGEPGAGYASYAEFARIFADESGAFDKTSGWMKNVIANRRMVFERMRVSSGLSPGFFIDQAVTADWNPAGGYFNLNSGKHRTVYLINRKSVYIPLKIKEEDYDSYNNTGAVAELCDYIINNNIAELPYPVWHPYFADMPYAPGGNFYNLLCAFTQWLSKSLYYDRRKTGYTGVSVYDETGVLAPFCRCLKKLGCTVDSRRRTGRLDMIVDRLYHIPPRNQAGDLMGDRLYNHMGDCAPDRAPDREIDDPDVVLTYIGDMERWGGRAKYGLFLAENEGFAKPGLEYIGRYYTTEHDYVCAAGKY